MSTASNKYFMMICNEKVVHVSKTYTQFKNQRFCNQSTTAEPIFRLTIWVSSSNDKRSASPPF